MAELRNMVVVAWDICCSGCELVGWGVKGTTGNVATQHFGIRDGRPTVITWFTESNRKQELIFAFNFSLSHHVIAEVYSSSCVAGKMGYGSWWTRRDFLFCIGAEDQIQSLEHLLSALPLS